MLEESFKTLNNGEKVTGTVVGISNNDVQVIWALSTLRISR